MAVINGEELAIDLREQMDPLIIAAMTSTGVVWEVCAERVSNAVGYGIGVVLPNYITGSGQATLLNDFTISSSTGWTSSKIDSEITTATTSHEHAHSDTTGRTVNDHHNQQHAIDGADHTGTLNHSEVADDEATKHRIINDSGTSSTELWSASKINSSVSGSHEHTHASLTGKTVDDHHNQLHDLGGSDHNSSTLAELNAIISDATLIDTNDSRLSDTRTPTSHSHVESDISDLDHNAQKIKGIDVNDSAIADGKALIYNTSTGDIIYGTAPSYPSSITGVGPPASTPSYIGNTYLDTTATRSYTAIGTSSSDDWKLIPIKIEGRLTISSGTGDLTLNLDQSWEGGFVTLHLTNNLDRYLNSSGHYRMETTYESLTNTAYTSNRNIWRNATGTGVSVVSKTQNEEGTPKAATTKSITFDSTSTTIYVYYTIIA